MDRNGRTGQRSLVESLTGDAEIAGHFSAAAEISAMLAFEAELASAQSQFGLIGADAAEAIGAAVARFNPDVAAIASGLVRDGVAIPVLVTLLRQAMGEPHARAVHVGATSQDAIDTGLMLRLRDVLGILQARTAALIGVIDALSKRQGATPLMAHTRMQAALPFSAADKLETWAAPLRAHCARLETLREKGLAVQLGGPIGTASSLGKDGPAIRAALAHRLGLRDAAPWHSDRSRILDIAHAFALLTGTLGKIGQDVALMVQTEVGAIQIQGGGHSSAMAHKQNPISAEVLVTLARLNAGLSGTLQQSMVHENERSGAAWTLEWLVLPQMAQAAGAALRLAEALLTGAEFVADIKQPPGPL